MENMLHSESLRTVTSVNGRHSVGRLGKLARENGYCSFRASPPKYERHKAFAVLDFPLGCGPFAPRIQSTEMLEQKKVLTSKEEKVIVSSDQVNELESVKAKPVKMQSRALNNAGLSEPVKGLEEAARDLSKDLHLVCASASKEEMFLPSGSKCWSPSVGPSAVPNCNGLRKTMAKKYPPRRKVSAIRDFPPLCGRNAPWLSKEESVKLHASPKNKSLGQEKLDMGDRPLEETEKTDLKRMREDVQNTVVRKSKFQGNVSVVIGDKVRANSNGRATKKMRKQDGFERSSEMKVDQEPVLDRHGKGAYKPYPSDSDGHATKKFTKQDGFGRSSEMKVDQEPVLDRHGKGAYKPYPIDSDGCATKKIRKKDGFGRFSEMKVDQEPVLERHGKGAYKPYPIDSDGCATKKIRKLDGFGRSSEMKVDQEPVLERHGKGAYKPYPTGITSEDKGKKYSFLELRKHKSAVRTKDESKVSGVESKEKNSSISGNNANKGSGQIAVRDKQDSTKDDDEYLDFHILIKKKYLDFFRMAPGPRCFGVNLPPIGMSRSGQSHNSDAITRNKVRETLRLFPAVCRKLLQEEEAKSKERRKTKRRVDQTVSKILMKKGKCVNTGEKILGSVPGVEVGDEFHYRIELNSIGLHRPNQAGIDFLKHDGEILAISIVSSGGYDDDLDNSDSLTYTGQGGNVMNTDKEPEDQKLERGNLALKNSMHKRNPVRVIRGSESSNGKIYIYYGLYLVEKYWQELGSRGKLIFKFRLDRIPGQPELAWKEVQKSKKFKIRDGLRVDDISQGKESTPIFVVNTIDDEKPSPFKYITSMIYPYWCRPEPLKGCNCINGCLDSEKCSCSVKNGGEIPFNYNGAIVKAKPLVYECGPSCKCPSSCHNRVSQHGIKFQLEIFKTKSKGWGVRSLNSIPSGSFVCEYIGELLEDKEAEQRTSNDEYLFDIGNNYNDSSLWDGLSSLMPDVPATSCEFADYGCFTIDAAQYGNVGRFINHSCSPNLYAQNVLYNHDDKRIPHIMLFAAENIPPLQELNFHYNMHQVHDSNGNIKKRSCFCGSIECTNRMY